MAEIRPQLMVMAIGMRKRAWNDCSSSMGSRPQTVVTVVSMMARRRALPAAMQAA